MPITNEEIHHLAALSGLTITEAELPALATDLDNIINYISQLDELDTDGVEPTYQVFEMQNIWRPDEITEQQATPDQLLALAPVTENNQIKVPKVL